MPSLEVCASAVARALLVRDPAVYSPWHVTPPFNALWHHIPLARRAFLGALPVYDVAIHHMDVMPEQMLMDPINQRIRPESMWAQDIVATWGGSDEKGAKIVRGWRFARGKLAKLMPVCLNFKGEWVRMDGWGRRMDAGGLFQRRLVKSGAVCFERGAVWCQSPYQHVSNPKERPFMKKELIEGNVARVKDILENVLGDDAIIMIASVNEDGNPVLDTIEGKPDMSKDAVCMLISAALTSIRDDAGSDGDVTEGYILEPVMSMAKEIQ